MIYKFLRLWHTVRFLKSTQILYRVWYLIVKPSINFEKVAPPLNQTTRFWLDGAVKNSSYNGDDNFEFLGVTGALSKIGWDGPEREKLWRYNQHYFDYLNSYLNERQKHATQKLLTVWLRDVPSGSGDGWEPYPTSLRIVNWVKWSLQGNDCPVGFDDSLASQARWLIRKLEFHLLGNHLFANAKALVFVGLYFDGKEAQVWLNKGLSIIDKQIEEQILADGGQFELSPMYHAIAFEDILDLINIANCYSSSSTVQLNKSAVAWYKVLPKMYRWLELMTHPDKSLAFFNDTTNGITPNWLELQAYYNRVYLTTINNFNATKVETLSDSYNEWTEVDELLKYVLMPDSGYVKIKAGNISSVLDVASIGPDYLPGHAHADTLSFELSVGKQQLFVNSGISCYGASAERVRQRGTAAHNTVVIDGEDSSEVWSGFRVARRARVSNLIIQEYAGCKKNIKGSCLHIGAEHDGYKRFIGKAIHSRAWRFSSNSLLVSDSIKGQFKSADARYHIHPDVRIHEAVDGKEFTLEVSPEIFVKIAVTAGKARIENSTWHPKFGSIIPNKCLVVEFVDYETNLLITT